VFESYATSTEILVGGETVLVESMRLEGNEAGGAAVGFRVWGLGFGV